MTKTQITKVAIWGASGHALVVADILESDNSCEIVGFLDDVNLDRQGCSLCGKTVLGGREQLSVLMKEGVRHIALGFGSCSGRIKIGHLISDKGFLPLSILHPRCTVSGNSEIGMGTAILAGAVVDSGCKVGDFCIINNNSTICHNSVIEDGAHICPGVQIAGGVKIGYGSWIGIGSCVADKVTIGARTFIGTGSVVVGDIPEGVLAYGNPARVVRHMEHEVSRGL
jgi:acetyltransferase EpsM